MQRQRQGGIQSWMPPPLFLPPRPILPAWVPWLPRLSPDEKGYPWDYRTLVYPFFGASSAQAICIVAQVAASQRRREDFIGHSLVRQGAAQSSSPFLSVQARHRKRYRACTLKRPYANRKHFYVPLSSEASGGISPYFLRRLSTNLSSVWVTALR